MRITYREVAKSNLVCSLSGLIHPLVLSVKEILSYSNHAKIIVAVHETT